MRVDWTPAQHALARRDWSRVPAGDAMDRAIDSLVYREALAAMPHPSRSPADALAMLDYLSSEALVGERARILRATLTLEKVAGTGDARWWACELTGMDWWSKGYGDTAELTICRALLDYAIEE